MPKERFANGDDDNLTLSAPDWEESWSEDFDEVEFCPVCGRRIEDCDCEPSDMSEMLEDAELEEYIWDPPAKRDGWEDEE